MTLINWLIRRLRSRSNCVVYAVWMFATRGGSLNFERSPLPGGLIRASWSPDFKHWYTYAARGVKRWPRWRVMINQIWFKGYVREYRRINVGSTPD